MAIKMNATSLSAGLLHGEKRTERSVIIEAAQPPCPMPVAHDTHTHSYSHGSGFITQLSLKQPGSGGAGDI